jgi:hypothetical protein
MKEKPTIDQAQAIGKAAAANGIHLEHIADLYCLEERQHTDKEREFIAFIELMMREGCGALGD